MGRRCCCRGCELIDDDFDDRTDGPVPANDPKWKVISGAWEFDVDPGPPIEGNVVSTTPGVLATRKCHPANYEHGSYIATMDLVSLDDTEVRWAVTVGDPTNPFYFITAVWNPLTSDMVVSVYDTSEAPGNLIEEYTYSGITRDIDTDVVSQLKVCYAPSLALSVSLGQNIPTIDICDDNVGDHCYSHGGDSIGGFAFAEGRFDNWFYEAHWLDDPVCDPCPCFCLKDRDTGDFSCYPKELLLTFVSVGATAATLANVTLYQQNPAGTDYPEKYYWYSEVQDCGAPVNAKWAIRFECPGIPVNGVSNLGQLTLCDDTFAPGGATQVALSWATGADPQISRDAIEADSTCKPLDLIFPELKVNCAWPAPGCTEPTLESPYCSNLAGNCYATCPDIRFRPELIIPP